MNLLVPFPLPQALEESIQVLWHAADKKGLELVIDVAPSSVSSKTMKRNRKDLLRRETSFLLFSL